MIVPPLQAETILAPSGENATELIKRSWALVFSLFSFSVAAREGRNSQFRPRKGDLGPETHLRPRL